MKKYFKVYSFETVKHAGNAHGIMLSGNDHYIGKDEKRRNDEIIHVELPYTFGNYCLFYVGDNNILKNALETMEYLFNHETDISERQKSELFKRLVNSLHIVHHKSTKGRKSKLDGINSLSTACLDNAFCLERIANKDSICAHCYSATQQKQQLALQDRNTINGIILRNIIIPMKYWKKYFDPTDLSKYFRIESFGDVQNKIQAINYINFMLAFPRVHFAAWTKNPGIWHFAFIETEKPKNLSFVISSLKLNVPQLHTMKTFSWINHVFTVYDENTIKAENISINCGGRRCMDCIKRRCGCYFRDTDTIINEKLK